MMRMIDSQIENMANTAEVVHPALYGHTQKITKSKVTTRRLLI